MTDTYFKQQAYDLIKGKILNCEYMPGSFINEKMIQERLSCSRTPIREALSKLEQEHLLHIVPKKGIRIADLSIDEISMIYETRSVIEPYILLTYGDSIDRNEIERFARLFSTSERGQEMVADDHFHRTLCAACPNRYLVASLSATAAQNQRVRVLTGLSAERIRASQKEHEAIVASLLRQDLEHAALAMKVHLEAAEKAALKTVTEHEGWVRPKLDDTKD
jgi:DNA-binding GntR family transcriptional regulator